MSDDLFLAPLFTWRSVVASGQGPASPTTRHVLLTLSLHMSERGDSCWLSQETVAIETGLSLRAVKQHMVIAHKEGWISSRERRTDGKAWRHKEYFSRLPASFHVEPAGASPAPAIQPQSDGSAQDALPDSGASPALGGAGRRKQVVHQVHASSSKNSPKNSNLGVSAPPLFDEAWKVYPKRNGNNLRIDAREAWQARLTEGVDPKTMLAGTIRYAAWAKASGKLNTELMRGSTFYGPGHPFEQTFTVAPDLAKPNVDKGCLFIDEDGERCPNPGRVAVLTMTNGSGDIVFCACDTHYYPPVNVEGVLEPAPQLVRIIERFKQSIQPVHA